MRGIWLLSVVVAASSPAIAAAQCPRSGSVAAAALADEGDRTRKVDIDGAIAKYKAAAELDPASHALWWKLALAYEAKEDWEREAAACARAEQAAESAEGAKSHADYYVRHGLALEQLAGHAGDAKGLAEAAALFRTAIAIDPNCAEAYGELGLTLLQSDDEAGAMSNLTLAIRKNPATMMYYAPLADLYRRFFFPAEEERVLKAGISFARQGDRHLFGLHALLGDVYESKRDFASALAEYEAAKASCSADACSGHREAFFLLGVAYEEVTPPRDAEALQSLRTFFKLTCKGAARAKYEAMCEQTTEFARRAGGDLR